MIRNNILYDHLKMYKVRFKINVKYWILVYYKYNYIQLLQGRQIGVNKAGVREVW
jgi:hypothetical protein